jgi:hypothetical protein
MDCKTARLLLSFHRPRAGDLDADDARALEEHLAVCAACDAASRAERRLEQHLGKAMRAVEVPDGLRTRLLDRLAAERPPVPFPRPRRRFWKPLVAAASLLLVLGLYWIWHEAKKPELDPEHVAQVATAVRPGAEGAEQSLRRLGVRAVPPPFLNYAFHTTTARCELPGYPGKEVGYLEFEQVKERGKGAVDFKRVRVFVVSERQFNLKGLEESAFPEYHLDVRRENSSFVYLIFYTGENYDWALNRE